MAKNEIKKAAAAPKEVAPPPGRSGIALLGGVIALVLSFVLLVALLHTVGALAGVEEGIYRGLKNVPVLGFLVRPLHHEKFAEKLTPEQLVDRKRMAADLIRTKRELYDAKTETDAKLTDVSDDVKKIGDQVRDLKKGLEEGTYTAGGAAPLPTPAAPAAAAITGTPAIAAPPPTAAARTTGLAATENYRAVAKIFEKIPPDTIVDIMNNLTDREKVEILSAMKENTVGTVLAAFDPKKAADLARMIAERKAK